MFRLRKAFQKYCIRLRNTSLSLPALPSFRLPSPSPHHSASKHAIWSVFFLLLHLHVPLTVVTQYDGMADKVNSQTQYMQYITAIHRPLAPGVCRIHRDSFKIFEWAFFMLCGTNQGSKIKKQTNTTMTTDDESCKTVNGQYTEGTKRE